MSFVYYDANGKILHRVDCTDPNETPPKNDGTPLYLDDTQYASVLADLADYTIENGVPVSTPIPDSTKLANAQQLKIIQLRQGYAATIAGGFNVVIGGTTYTFGWSTDDKANMLATQEAITDAMISFPINYSDINGRPVSIPDQTTLTSIKSKATSFFANQHQQILNLVGQAQLTTTVSAVNAIQWTAATY